MSKIVSSKTQISVYEVYIPLPQHLLASSPVVPGTLIWAGIPIWRSGTHMKWTSLSCCITVITVIVRKSAAKSGSQNHTWGLTTGTLLSLWTNDAGKIYLHIYWPWKLIWLELFFLSKYLLSSEKKITFKFPLNTYSETILRTKKSSQVKKHKFEEAYIPCKVTFQLTVHKQSR